jgi:hypothetical protein
MQHILPKNTFKILQDTQPLYLTELQQLHLVMLTVIIWAMPDTVIMPGTVMVWPTIK